MSLLNSQDSGEGSYSQSDNIPLFIRKYGLLLSKGFLSLVLVFAFSYNPQQAHAGLLSFFLGGDQEIKTEEPTQNSQTVALPQPSASVLNGKGGSDTTIISDSALSSETGPLGTQADISEINPENDGISIYVVRKGDSLSTIAKMFDVSVNTIIWANDLKKGQSPKEGDTLVILPVSGVKYVIKKGDTLKSIAKKFKADADDIGKFNGITEETILVVGDTLILPDGEIVTAPSPVGSSKAGSTLKKIIRGVVGTVFEGYYIRPIKTGVRSQGLHGRNGVDLAAPIGTPIMAAASGTVVISKNGGWNGGYGSYVVISHPNGTQTLYGHMTKSIVEQGEIVSQGQLIGYVGNTGKSTGPHVHFEVRGAKNPGADNSWAR